MLRNPLCSTMDYREEVGVKSKIHPLAHSNGVMPSHSHDVFRKSDQILPNRECYSHLKPIEINPTCLECELKFCGTDSSFELLNGVFLPIWRFGCWGRGVKNAMNQNNNSNGKNGDGNGDDDIANQLKTFDNTGEATVLETEEIIADLVSEATRRTKVKRRTSSTIRKIQEMIKEEQLKDFRGTKVYHENITINIPTNSKFPVTKTAGLAYKNSYRQRSKSRSKPVRVNFDQPQRPFRRWLGVSTCVASDTRFIVEAGKSAVGNNGRNWRDAFASSNIKERERNTHQSEQQLQTVTENLTSSIPSNEHNGIDFKTQNNMLIGNEKRVIGIQKQARDSAKLKILKEACFVEPSRITVSSTNVSDPLIKIFSVDIGDTDSENPHSGRGEGGCCRKNEHNTTPTGHECECSPKQIVNVEANEGVIHIHQQSHGSMGNVTNKSGSIKRTTSGNSAVTLSKTRHPPTTSKGSSSSSSSTFKSLKKKFKKAHRKHDYISVQAINDSEGTLPGQLSFKKGQIIKQMNLVGGQCPVDGMCYGYYRTGKLQRKVWGIYPSSHVSISVDNKKGTETGEDSGEKATKTEEEGKSSKLH